MINIAVLLWGINKPPSCDVTGRRWFGREIIPKIHCFSYNSNDFVKIQPCVSWEHDDSHKFGGSNSETDASGKVTRSPSLINDNYIDKI